MDYSQFNLELANAINAEMTNMVNTFGDVIGAGYIKSVEYYPGISDWYAAYNPDLKALLFKNVSYADILSRMKADANDEYSIGFWSTSDTMHIARHEAGHAIGNWLVGNDPIKAGKLRKIRENVSDKCGIIEWKIDPAVEESIKAGEYISYYALKNNNELIAESIAEYMTGNPRETAREVISILMEG